MGIGYEFFLNMTWIEFRYNQIGYERRLERQWDTTRHLIAASFNSSGFSKKVVKATEVVKLPHIDRPTQKKLRRVDEQTIKDRVKLLQKSLDGEHNKQTRSGTNA